ncbi:hypothetical protein [Alteribacter aurantiacus]|uniref:hypothetical protein n=1 Tax=Alteribacter aurantiacus TaxID=254410 RepID=UPI00042416D0|nr:hypothetical protein [Alteribacter aurantiacus]
MTAFVGLGKLAQSVLSAMPQHQEVYVFSRTKERVTEVGKEDSRIKWLAPEQFRTHKSVWLFLPKNEVVPFIKKYKEYFHPKTCFYVTATALMKRDVENHVPKQSHVVPCKFITQADQLKKDSKGFVVVDSPHERDHRDVSDVLGNQFTVVRGNEKHVLDVNKAATKVAIEAVVRLEKQLKDQGVDSQYIEQGARQIIPGVIGAYLDGELGGFGKQVIKEIEDNET